MNTTYGLLLCKFGPLGHGPIDVIRKEMDRTWKGVKEGWEAKGEDPELRIVEYDHRTHDVDGSEIVERAEPLKYYSPQDLYSRTPLRVEYDLWRWKNMLCRETNVFFDNSISKIEIKVLFEDNDRMLATFWFEGEPFMIGQYRCYGDDDSECEKFVTNKIVFWKAMDHLVQMNRPEIEGLVDPNTQLVDLTNFGYTTIILK